MKVNLKEFFEEHVTAIPAGYTNLDRYRDFRRVFLETEEGGRVLAQIIAESDSPVYEEDMDKPGLMAGRAGKRLVGMWIVGVLNAEPEDEET